MLRRLTATLAAIAFGIGTSNAFAQEGVPLRAVYQGTFLPEGTEIVVMTRGAGVERDGRPQPEFIARGRYPREPEAVHRRDVLARNGFSSREYSRTDRAGSLYFLYALTPDSTVYWSYSAQRDSLKFDVVSTGVMSVAPILTADMREDVLRRFFQRRVHVRMPGDLLADHLAEDEDASGVAGTDSVVSPEEAAEVVDSTSQGAGDVSGVPPVASATPPSARARAASSHDVPLGLPAVLALGLITITSVVLARKHRREARRLRLQLTTVRMHREEDPVGTHARELDDLRRTQGALRRENAALRKRCADLEGELSMRSARTS